VARLSSGGPEVRDDRRRCWRRLPVGEVAIRWGTTGAWAGWAGRETEAQWEEGEEPVGKKKKMGRGWAERPDGPEVMGKILFRIKFDF
jgi:hypothetical protein